METREKQLKVNAIRNGTVLDHIPSSQLFRVIDILQLYDVKHQITFGMNLDSKLLGKKAIIKISGKFFEDDQINMIALIAPMVSINIINDFEVVSKRRISVPETISGVAKCANPVCITNHQEIETKFVTVKKDSHIDLQCIYCEKITDRENLKIISNLR